MERGGLYRSYAKDILRDDFYSWIEDRKMWIWLVFMSWGIFFSGGVAAGLVLGWPLAEAVQFGLSLWLWGVIVRTVVHCHFTWAVNSVTHLWGYRNYETADNSRNNALIAFISNGEGWHNNHHADPMGPPRAHLVGSRRGLANDPFPHGNWAGHAGQNARFAGAFGPCPRRLAQAGHVHRPVFDPLWAAAALLSRSIAFIITRHQWRSRMARGTVKWFDSQKGYGFIQPEGGSKDVFVHISAVERAGLSGLNEGQIVEYEEVANKGKTLAENLKVHR